MPSFIFRNMLQKWTLNGSVSCFHSFLIYLIFEYLQNLIYIFLVHQATYGLQGSNKILFLETYTYFLLDSIKLDNSVNFYIINNHEIFTAFFQKQTLSQLNFFYMQVTETNFGHLHEEFILRRWGYHTLCRADDEVELQESSGTMKQKDWDFSVSSRQQSEDRLKTSQTLQVQISVLSQAAVCREGPFSKTNPSHSSPNYLLPAELPEGPLNFSKCHQKNRTNFMGTVQITN